MFLTPDWPAQLAVVVLLSQGSWCCHAVRVGVVPLSGLRGEELQTAGGDQGDGGYDEDCWNWPGERGARENVCTCACT